MEPESQLTEALGAARADDVPWHSIGRILRQRFMSGEKPLQATDVWHAAEHATNLKSVVLKRFVVLADRLDRVSLETGLPVSDLVSLSYGAVELALRLYDRDRIAGLRALADLRERKMTIAALQRKVTDTPAGPVAAGIAARSAALARRAKAVRECRIAIASYASQQFGEEVETIRRPKLRHFHRTGFEAVGDDKVLAGFDLHLPEWMPGPKDLSDGLARSLLLACQLPFFAIVFSPEVAPATAREWAETASLLGMWWIGMLVIGSDGSVQFPPLRPLEPNPMSPDPALYIEMKNKLAVRR